MSVCITKNMILKSQKMFLIIKLGIESGTNRSSPAILLYHHCCSQVPQLYAYAFSKNAVVLSLSLTQHDHHGAELSVKEVCSPATETMLWILHFKQFWVDCWKNCWRQPFVLCKKDWRYIL